MKIPDRKTINTQLAESKRSQIDEGVRIAKKIDVLRDSLLDLERSRNDFIQNTAMEIEKANLLGQSKLEEIKKEIKKAEEYRGKLREPLDLEWQNLEEEQFTFDKDQEDFKNKQIELAKRKEVLQVRETETDNTFNRNNLIKEEVERLLNVAKQEQLDADVILNNAKANEERVNQEISDRLKEVVMKEEKVEFDLKANEQIKKNYEFREKELIDLDREIKDRYATLLRAEEYIKNK